MINFDEAATRLEGIITKTECELHQRLSDKYHSQVYLKREDQQPVRSYKLRGAYNKIASSKEDDLVNGVVCASAGNHAQGVAYSCSLLGVEGKIFMPANTPVQKINRVKYFGGGYIEIFLGGENYDECAEAAIAYSHKNAALYISPFDDERIIEGQGTIGKELVNALGQINYLFLPVGGGGLAAGVGKYFSEYSPGTIVIGLEPEGAASMSAAFDAGYPVCLPKINPFVDGAAVWKVGDLTYRLCRESLSHIHQVPEGKICSTLLSLYNDDGLVCEPAGALSIAGLDDFADEVRGKTVVCILSGSNNDSNRFEDIKKLANEWEGLQHHLVIRFHHKPDGIADFFGSIVGTNNHVNRIEYNRRDHGRSTFGLVGVRSESRKAYQDMISRLEKAGMEYREVAKDDFLFKYWV